MKLEQWPETEMDYWQTIEGIGGFLWSTNHELGHGRIENSPCLQTEMKEARNIQAQLVEELFENFGVVHPKDSPKRNAAGCFPEAPFGMKWYLDWYEEMKRKYYQAEYEKVICSACPLSDGLDKMISLGGVIPCGVFNGTIYQLNYPYKCSMLGGYNDSWTEKKLFEEIYRKAGDAGLKAFIAKLEELKKTVF